MQHALCVSPTKDLNILFSFTSRDASQLITVFQSEMRRGLAGDRSSIAMRPSFVGRPSGTESGRFVTLDLGGTNLRATVVEIADGALNVLKHDSFRLASASGSASDLFDPIARFLGEVLEDDGEYSLGFIFAFPMNQTGSPQREPVQVDQGAQFRRRRG